MTGPRGRWLLARLLPALLLLGLLVKPAPAAEPSPCQLAGPAGTASVLRLDLPRGSRSLALRVTTDAGAANQSAGRTGSWHLATQIAVLRASDGRLVAHRAVQLGSSPRAVVVSSGEADVRAAVPAVPAPFRHTAASVPPYLPAGRYLLVAYGTDGSPAVPNPGWSAEASFSVPVTCAALQTRTSVLDRDQSSFTGGTQIGTYGAGTGTAVSTTWSSRERFVVGLVDAGVQAVGTARLVASPPRSKRVLAEDALQPFAGSAGTYRFTADWTGAFPLVLVCAVAFTV